MNEPGDNAPYPEVADRANYPELEAEIGASWQREHTFETSVEMRPVSNEYVFYDGPPFANGLPHYGHLLTGFVKDAVPRYQTMREKRVERRFGWDCHGLPAETEAEKELGVSGRGPITDFGIDKFNDYCKTSVLRYTHAWQRYVTRQGRWVDFDNDYKTMDLSFMESVMWAFKELHQKGLIYEAYRVLPYCWECETPLSNSETRQDDALRERIDPAVTVAFGLEASGRGAFPGPLVAWVWTTTPWTLPSNLALAVGREITYAVFERDGEQIVLSADRIDHYAAELEGATRVGELRGEELLGRHYTPLFPYFASERDDHEAAFSVLEAPWVTTDEGTGIVHMAPGFGEDDQRTCEQAGIAVVCPVDDRGRFDERVPDFSGQQVFEANENIIDALRSRHILITREAYAHNYPHCWRTETPLIYRAVSSFFVEVTAIKDRLLAANEQINWAPEHVRDGAFGKWLEGARDWSISRNRFWGAPIPVWKSDNPEFPRVDVYGSLDELEADFGVRPDDLHRPGIDELVRPNPDDPSGQSMMRRVSDVLDCWFESGSMPFAQLHYPFENVERFEEHFPADFICEYMGQTRAWFYHMHVVAVALFDRPAFSNCIAHGILLGDDGRKLSKRLRNYPDPEEFFERFGADTMRWYLLASPVLRGLDIAIEEQAMTDPIRQVLNPIWNSWHFLSLYGRIDEMRGTLRADQTGVLDRYILAKTAALRDEVTAAFDRYDLAGAAGAITAYLDALTNWYVRRSRPRFWAKRGLSGAIDADKRDAYDTLHTVLHTLCRLAAPLLPYLTDNIFRGLTGEESVHLADWPATGELPHDDELVAQMDLVREVCSAGNSIRKARHLRSRLPLRRIEIASANAPSLSAFTELIADELNVKDVVLSENSSELTTTTLNLVPALLGPRLGPSTQVVMRAHREGRFHQRPDGRVEVGGIELEPGEYELGVKPLDPDSARVLDKATGVVILDTATDEELEREGAARDVTRRIQQARKDIGLQLSDRINVQVFVPETMREAVEKFRAEIAAQVLADELVIDTFPGPETSLVYDLGEGEQLAIVIEVQQAP
jgi:isoleucyl-tRNA synthetase